MNEESSTPDPRSPAAPDGAVGIEIPASLRYVALTRVAAASLAADLDPTIDDIEDLRVAVNELVGLLVEASIDGQVHLRMWCDGSTLHVTGRCTGDAATIVPDQLTLRILDATIDGYSIATGSFEMHKRLDEA
ncbi:MAG: hypothetical protein JST64_01655 [Actinobacteria bacterium]|nr:hypothetical protein [Actinomycetota bacterium]